MAALALELAVRLALCAGCSWLAFRQIGPVGLLLVAPLYGMALARPLLDISSGAARLTCQLATEAALKDRWPYKGRLIHVIRDAQGDCWLRLEDLRRIAPELPSDRRLRHRHPHACSANSWTLPACIRLEAAVEALAHRSERHVVKLVRWLQQAGERPPDRAAPPSRADGRGHSRR